MTRNEILDAAAIIFSRKGFEATSMADIAEAVGLQKASLYHHFESKQELLVELLDQALDLLIERIEPIVTLPLPPDQRLRRAMSAYLGAMVDHRELASILLLEHRSLEPEYLSRHIPRRDRFERLWRDLIQQGYDTGLFCCSDPALATRALMGVMNWSITWYNPGGRMPPGELSKEFADLFLNGLLARPG